MEVLKAKVEKLLLTQPFGAVPMQVDKMLAIKFSKCAFGRRGLTAMPFAAGLIKVGDEVEILLPQSFE
jgi:hypothetical protein